VVINLYTAMQRHSKHTTPSNIHYLSNTNHSGVTLAVATPSQPRSTDTALIDAGCASVLIAHAELHVIHAGPAW
jgi:hypothetical protein